MVIGFSLLFYRIGAANKKDFEERPERSTKPIPTWIPPEVKRPVAEDETSFTIHGSIYSSAPQEVQCDKCGWEGMPFSEGKIYRFCPGCGRPFRLDIVKGNDI
jgi:hypothetical protein